MATLLETIGRMNFFRGIHCPYEFFIAVYHTALRHQAAILDEWKHSVPSRIEKLVFGVDLDTGVDVFDVDGKLNQLQRMISNDRQAAQLVAALLRRLDVHLGGAGSNQYRDSGATGSPSRILDRLGNPFYYHPISVNVGDETVSYTIIPKMKPLYAGWITEPLPRDEEYFTDSLDPYLLEHHRLLPNGCVGGHALVFPANGANSQGFSSFLQSIEGLSSLKIGLAPYDAGFTPDLMTYCRNRHNRIPFRYLRIKEPGKEVVKGRLETVLTAARDSGVDVLVFPELTVDHDAFTAICDFLAFHNERHQLKLVVAGSFHREREEGGYVNQARMLDWNGNIVWEHNKLHPFVLLAEELTRSRTRLQELFKPSADAGNADLEENIHTAHPLSFVDTPAGRMTTLICLDYLQDTVAKAVGTVCCHFVWIPAMTTSIGMFESHAKDVYGAKYHLLSACSASVSCCETVEGKAAHFSFIYGPSKKFGKVRKVPNISSKKIPLGIFDLDGML